MVSRINLELGPRGCNFSLFGYMHEVVSLALEERKKTAIGGELGWHGA